MDTARLAKQTLDFYRTNFENTFRTLTLLQEQTQVLIATQMEQTAGLPAEGKKLVNDWMKAYRKNCEEFKKAVDENFNRLEEHFVETGKASEK